jgi:pimeloyl-ACP methyl ester carboxylesterase
MNPVVFLPGFDGEASLRSEFVAELGRHFPALGVSYPRRMLGSLDAYRTHAMAQVPVDWNPVLVAESFSGLVAASWAAVDSRVSALVMCAAFARNPVGYAASIGATIPGAARLGSPLMAVLARFASEPRRRAWGAALSRVLRDLPADVVAERLRLIAAADAGPHLSGLRIPVVIVQFESDAVIGRPARDHLEAVCHNAHILRIPGPHFALETRPAECAQAIAKSLAGLVPTRA